MRAPASITPKAGMDSAPPGNTGMQAVDIEQPSYVSAFESSRGSLSQTPKVPWWRRLLAYGQWQELATSEKDLGLDGAPALKSQKHHTRLLIMAVSSVSINVMLVMLLLVLSANGSWRMTSTGGANLLGSWAMTEASSVTEAASIDCSGKGVRYGDTAGAGCECHQCYQGLDCSELVQNCTVDLSSGTPTLFQDYWASNLESSAALIPGNYRLGYSDGNSDGLEAAVRRLHATVGNVNTANKQLIIGAGSTELIFGLMHAIGLVNREGGFEGKTAVTSKPPYYNLYSFSADFEHSDLFEWKPYADVIATSAPSINFVVSPNNPDGRLGDPELPPPSIAVHDFAYYWPHFTPMTSAADYDVMIFTMSKVSGHAGSRVGWAWVRDPQIAAALQLYLGLHSLTMAHESQYRAIKILNAIADGYESVGARTESLAGLTQQAAAAQGRLFHYAKLVMQNRWDRLHSVLGTTGTDSKTRVTIQPVEPAARCNFFQQTVASSPAYAFIHCQRDDITTCFDILKEHGILGRPGVVFGGEKSYLRLSLLGRESDFALALERLKALVDMG